MSNERGWRDSGTLLQVVVSTSTTRQTMEGTHPSYLSVISILRFYSKAPTIFPWTTLISVCLVVSAVNRWMESKGPECFLLMAEPSCLLLMLRKTNAAPHTPTLQTLGQVRRQGCQLGNKSDTCSHTGTGWLVWPGEESVPGHLASPDPFSMSENHQEILWRAVTIWKLWSAHGMSHESNLPHNRDKDRFWNNEDD